MIDEGCTPFISYFEDVQPRLRVSGIAQGEARDYYQGFVFVKLKVLQYVTNGDPCRYQKARDERCLQWQTLVCLA